MSTIGVRKLSHLELCESGDVEGRRSTLLEHVHLLHQALPELAVEQIDPSIEVFGRRLRAPLIIAGMTGGAAAVTEVNRSLARAAQACGIGMGVGSQRAMLVDASAAASYLVRDLAPDIPLLANIGVVQARDAGVAKVRGLIDAIGADALCIHMNVAQELVQDGGDRDFRGCVDALANLRATLPVPVVAKETGCGMSPAALERIAAAGIEWVDVSGTGGTTWPGVEALRGSERQRALGTELREWGIPTAASILYARAGQLRVIASGGIRSAGDIARAIALGADAVALALPLLRAHAEGGSDGVIEAVHTLTEGLIALMLLTGSRTVHDLQRAPRILDTELTAWLQPTSSACMDRRI